MFEGSNLISAHCTTMPLYHDLSLHGKYVESILRVKWSILSLAITLLTVNEYVDI